MKTLRFHIEYTDDTIMLALTSSGQVVETFPIEDEQAAESLLKELNKKASRSKRITYDY